MVDPMSRSKPDVPTPVRSPAGLVALAGGLLLLGSGGAYLVNRAWASEAQVGASLGVVCLLVAVLIRPAAVEVALTGRQARYGSNAGVVTLAFMGILVLVNYLAYQNNQEYDLTETRAFTLSAQTTHVLKSINQPVQVIGFFQAGDDRLNLARNYLERYSRLTGYLTYEFHDPHAEPALARTFELATYGLVFVSGDKRYQATAVDEQTLTNGLLLVTRADPELVSIRPQPPANRDLHLSPAQENMIFFTTLIFIPLFVLAAGLAAWWKRR